MPLLVLASASPRRRELLTQAGFSFQVRPADIAEELRAAEDPITYVTRLAREKAEAVYRELAAEPCRKDNAGVGYLEDVSSHPSRKNKDAARVGHPLQSPLQAAFQQPCQVAGGIVVLGADTTVTVDEAILGKPENAADAARMLRMLSGRTHRVITGVAVVGAMVPSTRTKASVSASSSETRITGALDRADAGESLSGPGRESSGTPRIEVAAEVTAVRFLEMSDEEIAAYIASGEPMDKAGAYAIQGRAARWIPRIEGDYFNVVGLPLALTSALLEAYGIRPGIKGVPQG